VTESSRGVATIVTAVFALLGILLGGVVAFYWTAVLQPRLKAEAVSQAEVLARSQGNFIAAALRSGDGPARLRHTTAALDELLLLRDARSGIPYFESIDLKIDYDVIGAAKGSLDIHRGANAGGGFRTEVALYDPETYEVLGISTFRVSDRFFQQLTRDVRYEMTVIGLAVVALLIVVWAVILRVMLKLQRQRAERRFVQEELKQAKEQAETANRAKSQFLANMSHEIRTPLNAIVGMTALAMKREPPPKVGEYLEKIRSSARLLAAIIEDILDLSRIEAGRLEIERADFDLDELLADISDVVGMRLTEKNAQKNVEIVFSTDGEVPRRLHGDPVRLKQVLLNLLNNALKFTSEGEIVVEIRANEVRRERAELEFSVRDTGIGIAPEHLSTLFEPFTQVDSSNSRKFGGAGLGLAISRRLVTIMGGEMHVQSTPGAGSTFSFTAPFDVVRGATGVRRLADAFRDLPVLVADDNASARAVLTNMLRSLSCTVTAVPSGEEAVEEAIRSAREGKPYRLAVFDWKMPGMDGAEAASRLMRTRDLPSRLPVILVTAYEREYATRHADEAGIDAVLHKPVSPSTLHDALLSVLSPAERRARSVASVQRARFSSGKKVLLVEDNEINREVARELLTLAGLEVIEAVNGYAALDAIASQRFDAVLMDVQMPELDGVETVKAIRAQEHLASLPVIAMTAHAMLGDRERFLDCGMSDYIAKPIDEEQLLAVLGRWIHVETDPRQTQAAPEAPSLPEVLPGLNVGDGIRRTSGNIDLYRRLIAEFRRDLLGALPKIRKAIEGSDMAQAHDLLHTLKGSAATMGARRVAQEAATLESWIRRGVPVVLGDLAAAIDEAAESIESLNAMLGGAPAAPPPRGSEAAVTAALLPIAKKMREHLDANNLAAVDCFADLKRAAGDKHPEPLRMLEESLDRLDFAAARHYLDQIEANG
jgi:signal transduction histidine kinase/DNA-binding response OmpR family regulator/HPt (histidine-containing phosphotransfer) domain-containing protein